MYNQIIEELEVLKQHFDDEDIVSYQLLLIKIKKIIDLINDKQLEEADKSKLSNYIRDYLASLHLNRIFTISDLNELKNELNYIEIILEKQKVELYNKENLDVINYYYYQDFLGIEILFIRSGKLIGSFNDILNVQSNYLEELESFFREIQQSADVKQAQEKIQELFLNGDENTTDQINQHIDNVINNLLENLKI